MAQAAPAGELFVLIGDTQRTLGVERLMGREQNDPERKSLLDAAAKERPRAFFFLGDMVALGSSKKHWNYFDEISAGIFLSGAKVLGLFGNHDYFGGRRAGERSTLERFPNLVAAKWGRYDAEGIRVLYLDSNCEVLGADEWSAELKWFVDELAAADADPKVRGVLTFLHHPPFTNSKTTGDTKCVKTDIVPAFLAARKTLAMVSGHAHGYERFEVEGRTFMVSAGGGGPRVQLLKGEKQRHKDLYLGPDPRPFHFVRVESRPDGIDLVAIGFEKGASDPQEFDRTTLRFR
jgi:Icc-related predicted phosphoesterase